MLSHWPPLQMLSRRLETQRLHAAAQSRKRNPLAVALRLLPLSLQAALVPMMAVRHQLRRRLLTSCRRALTAAAVEATAVEQQQGQARAEAGERQRAAAVALLTMWVDR